MVGAISIAEYEVLLGTWDQVLGRIRKKLTTKSPVFKTLTSQLAKVRSLDTCLAYGLTPAGGRATGRFAKLIQSDELRGRLGVPAEIAEAMEDAFSMDYPGFLASLESLITALYDFKPALHTIQFCLRDRLPAVRPGLVDMGRQVSKVNHLGSPANQGGSPSAKSTPENRLDGRETTMWADAAELDEVALRLLMGSILLGLEMAGGLNGPKSVPQFQTDGKLRFPAVNGLSSLGDSDPFLAFATLLWSAKRTLGDVADPADLESSLMRLIRLSPDERQAMKARYTEWIGPGNRPSSLVPGLGKTRLRDGWRRGFERGFMAEVQAVWEGTEGSVLEQRLLELLTEVQTDIDSACETLEVEKSRLTRERLARILD